MSEATDVFVTPEAVSWYFCTLVRMVAEKLHLPNEAWRAPHELLAEIRANRPEVAAAFEALIVSHSDWALAVRGVDGTSNAKWVEREQCRKKLLGLL